MITHHLPLRSNMSGLLAHISAGAHRKTIFTRTEIIKKVRAEKIKKFGLAELKERMFPTPIFKRIANVRKFKGGYKVVGICDLLDLTNSELTATLKRRGFTGARRGGVVVNF